MYDGPLASNGTSGGVSWPLASNGTSGVKPGVCLGCVRGPLLQFTTNGTSDYSTDVICILIHGTPHAFTFTTHPDTHLLSQALQQLELNN